MSAHELPPDDAWLRRLARSLTADDATASDLCQDALVAREVHAPGAGRAWLATTLRNLWVSRHRERVRRDRRESLAARPEALPATDVIVERIEMRERVLAAVRELDDLHREVIVLRYFEDLTPVEIARRSGCPVRTVHTRLHRALGRLREGLDRRFGDRTRWTTALLALPAGKSVPIAAAVIMLTKTKLVAIGVVAIAIGLTSLWERRESPPIPPPPTTARAAIASGIERTEEATRDRSPADGPENEVLDAFEELSPEEARLSMLAGLGRTPTLPLGGMVVDLEARPVPRIEVYYDDFSGLSRSKDAPILTDENGRFTMTRAASLGHVKVGDPRWVAVLEPHLYDNDREHLDLTIVVARPCELRGTIVDENGKPLSGVSLALILSKDLRINIPRVLDRAVGVLLETKSDDSGEFRFEAAPDSEAFHLLAQSKGMMPVHVTMASVRMGDPIVMRRLRHGDELRGRVLTREGVAATAAKVTVADLTVAVDGDGNFLLPLWQVEQEVAAGVPAELRVDAPGRVPTKIYAHGAEWRTRGAWPADLNLTIGDAALSIRGRVVRHDGSPAASPSIDFVAPSPPWIDPTSGSLGNGIFLAPSNVDASAGEFETRCVPAGRYRLRVFLYDTLELHETEPIEAGTSDVEIRLPERERWPRLRGRVVDRRGDPVAGADWIVERAHPDHADGSVSLHGHWHQADPEGWIEHAPLDRAVTFLCVKAAGMAEWKRFPIGDLAGENEFRVTVPVGCRARIRLGSPNPAVNRARLIDLRGEASPVVITHGNTAYGTHDIGLIDGLSESFVALDDCVELVLYAGDSIVQRIPIQLRPDAETILGN